ncbi:MAG: efflux RND transporter periplasmic adaptor subunit [Gemmatimonadota bacterium]|nr:efflux RND transporter periplasmic adaptor subunit [Gemmatimonadota bacterium]
MNYRSVAGLTWAAAVVSVAACAKAPPPKTPRVPVIVATARRTSVPYTISTNGVVEPMQTAAVEAQVGGILTRVTFTEGQQVKAGQVLFEIDPRPYIAVLDQGKAQLARDEAQAANARRDAARYATLVSKDYVTRSQADQASAAAASAGATVDADRAAVEHAQLDVANSTIRAPISGRTGGLLVRMGNLVKANASTPMVVINQIQPILVRFSIPQSELPDIQRYFGAGKPLAVQASLAEGSGVPLFGTLAFVDNNVDSTTGTVLLKARFDNPAGNLWPGQFVTVALRLYVDPNALTVPAQAVLNGQQGTYVFTVDSAGNTKQRPVQVARTVDTLAVIASGLSPGDRVITDGQSRLVAGSKVIIKAAQAGRKSVAGDSSGIMGGASGTSPGTSNPGSSQ